MFDSVYSEDHPLMTEQREWLAAYERSMAGGAA
jgi:pyruvate dehydrogenase E1 component alpha subunit